MENHSEQLNINEVDDSKDKELMKLIEYDKWKLVVRDVVQEILKKPDWLEDKNVLPSHVIHFVREGLKKVEQTGLATLDDLILPNFDGPSSYAFAIRFMETFSNRYDFAYVWRGGEMSDLDRGVNGTFTYFSSVAKSFVSHSYSGSRTKPCLIGVPVKGIVEDFRERHGRIYHIFEHGYDGIFNASFDLYMPKRPAGTKVYRP